MVSLKDYFTKLGGTPIVGLSSFAGFPVSIAASVTLGTCLLAIATHWGIGLYPDSIVYIGIARSIVNGDGVRFLNDVGELTPVTQYPPLYPWMIAVLGVFGLDPLDSARWISILFYAANALLAARVVYRATSSYSASWVACFLSLSAFPMVYIHSQALTEPVFIFFILLGFWWIVAFLEGSQAWTLYCASLIIGLSCLVRYVGMAFLPTGGALILFLSTARWRQRIVTAAQFMILGSVPLAAWVLRNFFAAGNVVNRTFGIHPPRLTDLLPALDTAGYWLLPIGIVENTPMFSRSIVVATLLLVVWLGVRQHLLKSRYIQALVCCLMGYALFLLVSMSFNDQPLYYDTRTLALPYMIVMIFTLCAVTNWIRSVGQDKKSSRIFVFGMLMKVVLAVQMINGIAWLKQSYVDGIGFAIEPWRTSDLIGFVRFAPGPLRVFSNAPDFIYTLANKPAVMIPRKVNPNNYKPNDRYSNEMDAMHEQLMNSDSVIVYFNDDNRLWYLPSAHELEAKIPLEIIKMASDGKIYRLKAPPIAAQP
jgi:4-amino-4-deoxy-L-arabinose transferase-like glycosyltransferase